MGSPNMKLVIIILTVAAAVSGCHPQAKEFTIIGPSSTMYNKGILIVGGTNGWYLSSAELVSPNITCSIGDTPEPRYKSSLCHGLVCGGWDRNDDSSRSCDKEANGTFSPTAVTLLQKREDHLCWGLPSGEVLLMGGFYSGNTTERVSPDGSSSSADFTLLYYTKDACGIDLGTSYVVTGGYDSKGGMSLQRVTQYSLTGEMTELPDLNTGRYQHACSHFVNTEGVTTLLVTGGNDGSHDISSTEIFTFDMEDWRYAASLPSPRDGLSGAEIGNAIFVFGGKYCTGGVFSYECSDLDDILQYNMTSDTWRPAGKMKTPRYYHSVAPVDDISQFCG